MAVKSILPFDVWPEGILQARFPANDNALRAEILAGLVISKTTTAQPATPADGDIYIIPAGATGAQWSLFDPDDLVICKIGSWYAFSPVPGVVVNFDGSQEQFAEGSAGWQALSGGGSGEWADLTGIPAPIQDLAALTDPGADRLLFWDDSAGVYTHLQLGTNLAITGTTLNAATGGATQCIPIACSDETTALTAGTNKVTFRMPFAMTGVSVRASLTTAQTSGSIFTVDVNEAGVSILSTKLTIDNTEKTSVTAATPPVVSDANLANDAEITIDIDQVGDGTAKGLKVYIIGSV